MKIRSPLLTSVLAAHAAFAASSSSAGHVPAGQMLRVNVVLKDAVLCDGSVRLEAGPHVAEIRSLGDGSVRATFQRPGQASCQASGKIVGVVVEGGKQPGAANAVVVEGGKQPSFASFGFTPQSQTSFEKQGNHLNVIVKGPGSNQILIGLLLPAVQKIR